MIGDIAHVCNRGFEKSAIFFEDADYMRFILNLYKLNNKTGALNIGRRSWLPEVPPPDALVDILEWSLLPNHYHLLLCEKIEGGIVEFVKRLGNGYTKYINIKYKRSGYLFQNSAKIILPESESHFRYLPIYIDLNPLDIIDRNWKENPSKTPSEYINFLRTYKWSSYSDYFIKENVPSLLSKEAYYELFETNPREEEQELFKWLSGDVPTWQVGMLE